MTGIETITLILIFAGIVLASLLNTDARKIYICVTVLAISVLSFALFEVIKDPQKLYWAAGMLNLLGIAGILRVFRRRQWRNEGYLLVVCGLLLLSAWNAIFYIHWSQFFPLYANMADTLALLTSMFLLARSDGFMDVCRQHYYPTLRALSID